MLPLSLPLVADRPLKVLCLGSHSDDIEIGCGGAVLELIAGRKNLQFTWVVFSSGGGARETEARASADLFLQGVRQKEVLVHGFRDSFFPSDFPKIKETFEELKRVTPDLVLTHSRKDAHQDHRVVAELTWNTFRNHLVLEYEIPKYDGDLGQPNVFMPLRAASYQNKVNYLMEAFASQRSKRWFQPETFMGLMRLRGMECNAESGYAEAFYGRKVTLGL
ncbi:MAG TPA: PIG-L deacetylase family protein [Terriglobales bacterium]|nr:PIG-L deacetylase family protein [Terriglobales bacterium]